MSRPQHRAGRLSAQETLELWRQYKASGDARLRDRLVLTFAPMVKYIVYKKVREIPARCDVDDFISSGLEALIRSIERYDPDKGATLEQFAWTRIHGAVLDELRRNDWAPRSLRRWDRDINRAHQQFLGLHGRAPTTSELGQALGVSKDELLRRQDQIARSQVASLNSVMPADDDNAIEYIDTLQSDDRDADPVSRAMREAVSERLRAALDLLPPREQKVAMLLYVYNLTLRQIGEILGVTESRVCQINGQITKRLRAHLAADEQLLRAVA